MPVPVPTVTPLDQVEETVAKNYREAPSLEFRITDAVRELVEAGALPRDRWRMLAHVLFCRAIYASHIQPLESRMTFEEIANHLNALCVPRFRGSSKWTGPAITDIREVVASPHNEISLPDP